MPKRRAKTFSANPKVAENRIRDLAQRWGLRLTRSRQRDGLEAGTYGLWNDQSEEWVFAGPRGYGKSLEECEQYLRETANAMSRAAGR